MLRLVDFNPDDFEQVSVFKHQNADIIDSKDELERIFSLISQWSNITNSVIKIGDYTHNASIEFDEDEIVCSELVVKLKSKIDHIPTKLIMCTEVFNQCYFIEEEIIDTFSEDGHFFIVIDIPQKIRAIKQRSYFRTKVEETYLLLNATESVKLLEIDTKSFVISKPNLNLNKFLVQFLDCEFECKVLSSRDEKTICIPDESQMDKFFKLFVYKCFPSLVERKSCNYKEVYELYGETGYFGNFDEKLPEDHYELIKNTWQNLDNSKSKFSFDFAINHNSKLVGISSSSLFSCVENTEHWYIHQLCSIKDENFFDYSGLLYIWRLVYLSMRPGNLKVYASFKSRSRWIEKIFLKYNDFLGDKKNLMYAKYYKASLGDLEERHSSSIEINWESVKINNQEDRYYANNDLFEIGINPVFLNANGNLNCIIFKKKIDADLIRSILLEVKGKFPNLEYVRLCLHSSQEDIEIPGYYQKSDRFYVLEKTELLDFAISITHTIEQLKRKYAKVAV